MTVLNTAMNLAVQLITANCQTAVNLGLGLEPSITAYILAFVTLAGHLGVTSSIA
jgi:hypothetical protein